MTFLRKILPLGLLAFVCFQPLAFAFDPATLDQKISEFIEAHDPAPGSGLAIAVIQNGKVIFSRGYGYRDREKKLPVTENTLFAIGSNSKAFTSTALAMLRDEGRVNFDLPIRVYLPDFELSNEQIASQITLKDILSHRTGLPRHDFFWYLTSLSSDELYSRLKYLPFNSDPKMGFRMAFQYNNLMYMVAGRILSTLEGKPWEEVIQQKILNPLQMTHTNTTIAAMQKEPDFAQPYSNHQQDAFKDIQSVAPAGAINSNLVDMEKWVLFYLNQGRTPEGVRLVSEDSLQLLESSITDASSGFGSKMGYGMGWFVGDVANHSLIWHGGNIDGFSAHVSFMPDERLGLVILTNQNNGSAFEFPIVLPATASTPKMAWLPWIIYKHLLSPGESTPTYPRGSVRPVVLPPTTSESLQLSDYVGIYSDPAYGSMNVLIDGAHLTLKYFGHSYELHPEGGNRFWLNFASEDDEGILEITFTRSGSTVTGFSMPLEPKSRPIFFSSALELDTNPLSGDHP